MFFFSLFKDAPYHSGATPDMQEKGNIKGNEGEKTLLVFEHQEP